MKAVLWVIALVALIAVGCSENDPATPAEAPLNFDILGSDGPASYDAAMAELADAGVTVSDPVAGEQYAEINSLNENADLGNVDASPVDDYRINFRRIVSYLHGRFRALNECITNSDNRQLHRVAYGAHLAMRRGMAALENGQPREALRYFHLTNRLLNLVQRMCREDGGRP